MVGVEPRPNSTPRCRWVDPGPRPPRRRVSARRAFAFVVEPSGRSRDHVRRVRSGGASAGESARSSRTPPRRGPVPVADSWLPRVEGRQKAAPAPRPPRWRWQTVGVSTPRSTRSRALFVDHRAEPVLQGSIVRKAGFSSGGRGGGWPASGTITSRDWRHQAPCMRSCRFPGAGAVLRPHQHAARASVKRASVRVRSGAGRARASDLGRGNHLGAERAGHVEALARWSRYRTDRPR